MKKELDPRINVKLITKRMILLDAAIITLLFGILIYIMEVVPFVSEHSFYLSIAITGYIVLTAWIISKVFSHTRYIKQVLPLQQLAAAARQVTSGDYSVRLAPYRKDHMIDEIETLRMDFNQMVDELASTEIMKNDFISNVSHELKTPIAVISNYSTILQSDTLTEEERNDYIGRINAASLQLSDLISNILQISRLDNQKIAAKPLEYDLSEQLRQCILGFELVMDEKGTDLQLDFDDSILITCDEGLLKIVWNNLLSNALKFTEHGGYVGIKARQYAENTVVIIQDNGCGISEKAQHHIFDKFYQEDISRTTKGNGLGLAMVKRIVELLQGSVKVESAIGKGSTFTVTLQNCYK
nr:HAMP domain-containing sensor histidine kinase [uncultured Clostridium sp.]